MAGLFQELKRRNVFRVAVTYLVAAWVVAQVSGLAANAFEAPAWIMQMILAVLIIGFFPAVIFAWIFELSPEGIKREADLVDKQAVNAYTAKRLDIAVIALLVLAIGLLAADRLIERPTPVSAQLAGNGQAPQAWSLDSIAVLPFADRSPDRSQDWLGEGIAETLLHALAQVEGLRVSARTSSFAYRDRVADVATIGRELGVATVLEGSVQRAGERLRVIAQLVRTDTQDQIFSKTFDRSADDIFAIQDEIAAAVSEALTGSRRPERIETERTRTEVYDFYLDGRRLWQERRADTVDRSVYLLRQAVAGDPDYGPAHSELATALLFQTYYSGAELDEHRAEIERLIDRALRINNDDAQAWAARGLLLEDLNLRAESLQALQRAESLSPGDANIQVWLGNRYNDRADFASAVRHFERALELDPLNVFVRNRYAQALSNIDPRHPRIEAVAQDTVRLFPDQAINWVSLSHVVANQGRLDDMVLISFDGFQQHSDSSMLAAIIAGGLSSLGEYEIGDQWLELAQALDENLQLAPQYYAFRDPERYLELSRSFMDEGATWAVQGVISGLRQTGQLEDALELAIEQARNFDQRYARGEVGPIEFNTLIEGVFVARELGRTDLAEQWLAWVERFVESMRTGGLREDDRSIDLLLAAVHDDWTTAEDLLSELEPGIAAMIGRSLTVDASFSEFRERPAVQAFIAEQEQQRERMLARVRREAPPKLFDPSQWKPPAEDDG